MISKPYQLVPPDISASTAKLDSKGLLRKLPYPQPGLIDFSSNNYLGLAKFRENNAAKLPEGATGSRLLTGHHGVHANLEEWCKAFFKGEEALFFNSGYMANIGILSALADRNTTIIYDAAIHASLKDGIRLSMAKKVAFHHNDLHQLEKILIRSPQNSFVVVEALHSMEGTLARLSEITALCHRYEAWLILDEAHSTGLYGANGEGLAVELGVEQSCWIRIHTFGKAVGRMGAVAIVPALAKRFLISRSRAFIYTTAIPPSWAASILAALKRLPEMQEERERPFFLRKQLEEQLAGTGYRLPKVKSPICPIHIAGVGEVKRRAQLLQQNGLDVRPIVAPTVPEGKERLRVVLHAYNTPEEVTRLAKRLKTPSSC